jgi:hypothetical protein
MNRPMQSRQKRARERGFVTISVLVMASMIFLVLGGALHVNYRLHDWNRKHNRRIQQRAATEVRLQKVTEPGASVR